MNCQFACPNKSRMALPAEAPEHVGDTVHAADEAERHAAFLLGKRRAELGRGYRHDTAASDRLHGSCEQQHLEAVELAAETAHQGAESEQRYAKQVDVLASVFIGELSHDGDARRIGERVYGEHPDAEESSTPIEFWMTVRAGVTMPISSAPMNRPSRYTAATMT